MKIDNLIGKSFKVKKEDTEYPRLTKGSMWKVIIVHDDFRYEVEDDSLMLLGNFSALYPDTSQVITFKKVKEIFDLIDVESKKIFGGTVLFKK